MDRPSWKRHAKLAIKTIAAVVVLGAVGWNVRKTWLDLRARGESVHLDPLWLAASAGLYLLGLSCCGLFYGLILRKSPSPIPHGAAVRAYLISHLGKYVPGKAMVVVMRVALSTPSGARAATAAIATFYETLVMMASGSVLAAIGFALSRPLQRDPLLLSAALAVAFLVVVDPWVFPRVSRVVMKPLRGMGLGADPHYDRILLVMGLLLSGLGWILMGMSQVAVVHAIRPSGIPISAWPLATAGVALGTVAGFVVALLPGGLGVREWVLMLTLAPALGQDDAVIAAILLRLTWIAAEAVAGALGAVIRPGTVQAGDPEPTQPPLTGPIEP
ncbi:MAG: lysylphosphatidylglycerol synthase domain-containing protein [Isosphaeraceae bacterium]